MRTRELQRVGTPGAPASTPKPWSERDHLLHPDGPRIRHVSSPNQPNCKLNVAAVIGSEPRPTVMRVKRAAKLLTVIGLTTKHAICRITSTLQPVRLHRMIFFFKLIRKFCFSLQFLENSILSQHSIQVGTSLDAKVTFIRNYIPSKTPGRVAHLTRKSQVLGSIHGLATYFRFSFR